MTQDHEHQPRNEWRKFGILAVILIGTIFVIALLRPLIFGHIVPAVIGNGLDAPPPVPVQVDSTPTEEPDSNGVTTTDEPVVEEVEEGDGETAVTPPEETTPSDEEPSTDEDGNIIYVVQPGDNLLAIAREYNVSSDDIMALNNLRNPNLLRAGDELRIPQN